MQRPKLLLAATVVALFLSLFALPGGALAHERRTLGGGKYDAVVGWDVEPAFEGQKNGAGIRLSKAGTNPAEPVVGAEKTLKIQIRQGATTREFPLRTVFGQQGYYVADLIPTRAGDYQFSFVGQIGDDQVNERFDSADGKFDGVKSSVEMQFPVVQTDPAQVSAAAQSAESNAQGARTMAMIGIGIGILGLLAAGVALATRGRSSAPSPRRATERV